MEKKPTVRFKILRFLGIALILLSWCCYCPLPALFLSGEQSQIASGYLQCFTCFTCVSWVILLWLVWPWIKKAYVKVRFAQDVKDISR